MRELHLKTKATNKELRADNAALQEQLAASRAQVGWQMQMHCLFIVGGHGWS